MNFPKFLFLILSLHAIYQKSDGFLKGLNKKGQELLPNENIQAYTDYVRFLRTQRKELYITPGYSLLRTEDIYYQELCQLIALFIGAARGPFKPFGRNNEDIDFSKCRLKYLTTGNHLQIKVNGFIDGQKREENVFEAFLNYVPECQFGYIDGLIDFFYFNANSMEHGIFDVGKVYPEFSMDQFEVENEENEVENEENQVRNEENEVRNEENQVRNEENEVRNEENEVKNEEKKKKKKKKSKKKKKDDSKHKRGS